MSGARASLDEPFELATADGWILRGELKRPVHARAVAVAGHAMMVDRRTLDRPRGHGLVSHLVDRGIAVVWPDLRGHGRSGPRAEEGGRWSYDDLVADLSPLCALARARFPGLRSVAVGHSLFGHTALAHLARHADEAPVDGLVMLACNMVHPGWRTRRLDWIKKRALIETMAALTRALGRFPTRALGLGTDDEAAPYVTQFLDWSRCAEWRAQDGFSYWRALASVRTPILALAAAGDRWLAPVEEARDLVAPVGSARFEVVGRESGLEIDPTHMGVVLDERCRPVWDRIADFVLGSSGSVK